MCLSRYTAAHTLDLYSEVAAICRPPLVLQQTDIGSFKKIQTPSTAYIISIFKVSSCFAKLIPSIVFRNKTNRWYNSKYI